MTTMDKLITDTSNGHFVMRAERTRTAQLANHLSSVALRHWEKALTGMAALPSAMALGIAAGATYGASLIERVFEVLETATLEIGHTIAQDEAHHRDRPEARA